MAGEPGRRAAGRYPHRGHYPAVDVLNSISRVAVDVVDEAQTRAATLVRRVLATWNDIEDLVSIGAYTPGTNADYDVALQTRAAVNEYLRQDRNTGCTFAESAQALKALGELIEKTTERVSRAVEDRPLTRSPLTPEVGVKGG